MKIGIIPAGGKSARWDGFPKELLPIGNSWTLLDKMLLVQTRALVDRVIIVSCEAKFNLHSWWVREHKKWPDIDILVADSVMDAIQRAILANNGKDFEWIFSMPDTYTSNPLFPETIDKPLMLGLFETTESERFGMLRDGIIVDKQEGGPGQAWGAFMFTKEVADFWITNEFKDHTEMLNAAMATFVWDSWLINLYLDVASMQDYLNLLGGLYAKE